MMGSLFQITAADAETFLLIISRVGGIIFIAPVFESRAIPVQVKVGLSAALALFLFPSIEFRFESPSTLALFAAMITEIVIGVIIGLGAKIIFSAIEMAGHIIGFQMGLGVVSVIDPLTQGRSSLLAQFQNLVGMLLFFSLNLHHIFLRAVAHSYSAIPLTGVEIGGPVLKLLMNITADMFVMAIKIGAPVIAVNLFVSVGLGIIARTVPQINVFIVGFPLKIGIGLLALGLSLPYWGAALQHMFATISPNIDALIKAM